jgi:hypothetical protein
MGTGGRIKAVREPARARQEHLFVRMYGVWVYIVSVGAQIFSMVSVGAQILSIRPRCCQNARASTHKQCIQHEKKLYENTFYMRTRPSFCQYACVSTR